MKLSFCRVGLAPPQLFLLKCNHTELFIGQRIKDMWQKASMAEKIEDEGIWAVRDVRKKISAEFDNDPKKLVAHYIAEQEKHRDPLLRQAITQQRKNRTRPPNWNVYLRLFNQFNTELRMMLPDFLW